MYVTASRMPVIAHESVLVDGQVGKTLEDKSTASGYARVSIACPNRFHI